MNRTIIKALMGRICYTQTYLDFDKPWGWTLPGQIRGVILSWNKNRLDYQVPTFRNRFDRFIDTTL